MTTPEARPGAVVAWWHEGDLAFGVVAGEEKQRVRLFLPGGREERVKPARVVLEVVPPGSVPGPTLEDRRAAGERAQAVTQRVREQAARVDVPLLWAILCEGLTPGDVAPAADLGQLAGLALDSSHGDAQAALILALRADGLHFIRRGEGWEPRTLAAVEEQKHEREAAARRQQEQQAFLAALGRAGAGERFAATGDRTERRYLDALEQVAVFEDTAPDAARTLAGEAIAAARVRQDRPHEGAFRVLRLAGRFASDDENLQLVRYRLATAFPPDVESCAAAAAERGFARDRLIDRTAVAVLSIDSPTTREIDDLLSAERRGSGFRVGVHIADPSSFVAPGDAVDVEALSRGLTHYMPDVRVLMLPASISERAASLLPGEERPALTYWIDLDAAGEVTGYRLEHTLVRSATRLSYDEADRTLADAAGPFAETLELLADCARARQAARLRRGAIAIQAREVEVKLDPERRPLLETTPPDSVSRLVVSEAMVLAGEISAEFCRSRRLPAIYRRQGPPSDGSVPSGAVVSDPLRVRAVRRTLRRAEIGVEPGPHASLGLEAYAQLTSPLRRFQDLATQRQILAAIEGRPIGYDLPAIQRIAATTEQAEADARRAERAAEEYWLLRWLEGRTGQDVDALVVEAEPRPVVQLVESLREQPMPSLAGVEAGRIVRVRIERVNPRAGLLVLRRID